MRAIGYVAAAVLAGVLVFSAVMRGGPQSGGAAPAASSVASGDALTLQVPTMHCPVACYPKVKATLESQPGVLAVELVPQQKAGEIDRPEVLIKTASGFDLAAATSALTKAGFDDAKVVQ